MEARSLFCCLCAYKLGLDINSAGPIFAAKTNFKLANSYQQYEGKLAKLLIIGHSSVANIAVEIH